MHCDFLVEFHRPMVGKAREGKTTILETSWEQVRGSSSTRARWETVTLRLVGAQQWVVTVAKGSPSSVGVDRITKTIMVWGTTVDRIKVIWCITSTVSTVKECTARITIMGILEACITSLITITITRCESLSLSSNPSWQQNRLKCFVKRGWKGLAQLSLRSHPC